MSKNQNKTVENDGDVTAFLEGVEDEKKREDSYKLKRICEEVSGEPAKMWGTSMIGFGKYHYKYDSGREGDHFLIGFSPRKNNLTVYSAAYNEELDEKKKDIGNVKLGKGCIYIKKLDDVDEQKLREVLMESIELTKARYPE